jgi:hypothetical protein
MAGTTFPTLSSTVSGHWSISGCGRSELDTRSIEHLRLPWVTPRDALDG